MSKSRKLRDGVIRLSDLTPEHIKNNEVTEIYITALPGEDGKLKLEGSWKELMKAILWLLYQDHSRGFTRILIDAKVIDREFDICLDPTAMFINDMFINAEKILGTPYFILYDYSYLSICSKIKKILELMNFKPRDVLLTLKPL